MKMIKAGVVVLLFAAALPASALVVDSFEVGPLSVTDSSANAISESTVVTGLPIGPTMVGERRTTVNLTAGTSVSASLSPDAFPGADDAIAFTFASGSTGTASTMQFKPINSVDATVNGHDRFFVDIISAPALGTLIFGVEDVILDEVTTFAQPITGPGIYEILYSDFVFLPGNFTGFDVLALVLAQVELDTPQASAVTYEISEIRTGTALPEPSSVVTSAAGLLILLGVAMRPRVR